MNRPRILAVAAAAALSLAAAACSQTPNVPASMNGAVASAASSHATQSVTVQYSSFIPSRVTISAGQTVVWNWQDAPIPHDVDIYGWTPGNAGGSSPAVGGQPSSNLSIVSPILVNGTWAHKFTKPGVYYYRCTVHAQMQGVVIVNP